MVEPATDRGVARSAATPAHSLVDGLGGRGDADHYHTAVVRLIDTAAHPMSPGVPAVLMRGGTSKGLFLHARHLPPAGPRRDALSSTSWAAPTPCRSTGSAVRTRAPARS